MASKIHSVKGTVDYYPEEMAVRIWLYQHMRQVSESFGYQEYEGPMLESLDLYAAKSSVEIIEKQSYVFDDRGGDRITLRPELTPTLARMVAQKQGQLTFPLRWWSFGPFWRYERPQKGRTREFFQWNIDMIGDDSPESDAELIIIAASFLKQVGLQPHEVQIRVNNRKLMDQETLALGISSEQRQTVYQIIDRRDKLSSQAWREYALQEGLTEEQIDSVEDLLENKDLWKKSETLSKVFGIIETYGIADYVSFDPNIIRGFLYYTGTVFEAWDTGGKFRALFGGGRYDDLVSDVGGAQVPAIGFAVGNMVIKLLLEDLGRLPDFSQTPADVYITVFSQDTFNASLKLAADLRSNGLKVTSHLSDDKLGKQFRHADRIGARIAVILGPDEIANQQAAVKNLRSGEQHTIDQKDLVQTIKKMLEGKNPS